MVMMMMASLLLESVASRTVVAKKVRSKQKGDQELNEQSTPKHKRKEKGRITGENKERGVSDMRYDGRDSRGPKTLQESLVADFHQGESRPLPIHICRRVGR